MFYQTRYSGPMTIKKAILSRWNVNFLYIYKLSYKNLKTYLLLCQVAGIFASRKEFTLWKSGCNGEIVYDIHKYLYKYWNLWIVQVCSYRHILNYCSAAARDSTYFYFVYIMNLFLFIEKSIVHQMQTVLQKDIKKFTEEFHTWR